MAKLKILGIIVLTSCVIMGCSVGKSGKTYYKEGISNVKAREYELAKTNMEKAIKENSEKAEYYIDYGLVLIMNEEYDQALVQFDRAILDKQNKVVRENNKRAYRGKGIAYYSQSRYEEAIREFEMASDIGELPKLDEDIQLYMGLCMERSGMYEESLAQYEKMLKEDKSNSMLYGLIGRVKYYMGDMEGALEAYNEAIKQDNKSYEYYIEKYGILVSMGDEQSGNEVLGHALSIKPKSASDEYQIGKINYMLGDYSTAIPQLEKAVEAGYEEGNYYLGNIYVDQEDYEGARNYYREYYENAINYHIENIYNQYAMCLINLKNYEEALVIIDKGLDQKDSRTKKTLLYNKVTTLEYLGRYKEAYEAGRLYIEEYPEDEEMSRELEFLHTRVS